MKTTRRITACALVLALGTPLCFLPATARASEEGQRNTAIGLTAAAAALLLTQKNKLPGIVVGAGAAYAWKRHQDTVNERRRRERAEREADLRWSRYERQDRRERVNRERYRDYRDGDSCLFDDEAPRNGRRR
ncbi:MAG: hypothetical protein RMJ43_03025 [Chloroherpetonaceae bacterium]|nr:hypothetical protein [Chthonomonadaceae bacterium]MDW8206782.1 hypothetical protein [Chloroherpetonaceae bacterium]